MTQASATNRQSIRNAERDAAIRERNRIDFLTTAMSLPQGRQFFFTLLETCQCFVNNPTFEPNRDYFAFGQRNIGLQLFNDIILHCPQHYQTMMREQNERLDAATARQRPGSQGLDRDVKGTSGYDHSGTNPDHDPYELANTDD